LTPNIDVLTLLSRFTDARPSDAVWRAVFGGGASHKPGGEGVNRYPAL
jgi:hypothetical protein